VPLRKGEGQGPRGLGDAARRGEDVFAGGRNVHGYWPFGGVSTGAGVSPNGVVGSGSTGAGAAGGSGVTRVGLTYSGVTRSSSAGRVGWR
jgi:hypothetical protein